MPKQFPERTNIDTRKYREEQITEAKGFLTFVPKTKIGEHLKAKILQVRRKSTIMEN